MGSKPDSNLSTRHQEDDTVSPRNKMFYRFFMIVADWKFLRNRILELQKMYWMARLLQLG